MFCSNCGKTLPADSVSCPSCGCPVGESRFEGSPYTSAQAHIRPGDDVHQVMPQSYTRTTYTSRGDEEVQGDVDARTTYRPTYGGDSMPEDIHREMRAAVSPDGEEPQPEASAEPIREETDEIIEDVIEDLQPEGVDTSKYRAQKIESAGQTGISSDVSELIQELEAEPRRGRRRRTTYEDYENVADGDESTGATAEEQPEVFDDIDEEEFEELRHSSFGLKQLLKILVIMVVFAAVAVGGVMWLRYIRSNQSAAPIENVGEELYLNGIAMIKEHASDESVQEALSAYTAADGGLSALSAVLQSSTAELAALTPEEPTENEQIFLNALNKIESNIANCITSDALAVGTNDAGAVAESDSRWQVVENSIAMLESATSAAELTAIINGQEIDVTKPEATPSPTPPVNYNTLSKDDKSDEVFEMQNRLYELGFLLDDRDGVFGSKTQTAVKMFQQAAGLEVTGIADGATLAALYADDAPRTVYAQPTATPMTAATPEPAPETDPAAAPEGDPQVQ